VNKKPIRAIMTALLLIQPLNANEKPVSTAAQRPNFLIIAIDDLNDWVGVMGGHPNAITPNIDRLARRGALFTNAHCAAPLCGPTRAALLTGLRPSTTGLYGHNSHTTIGRNQVAKTTRLLPRYLSGHGYRTLSTGKIFHNGSPAAVFDETGVAKTNFGPNPKHKLAYQGKGTSTDWGPFPARDEDMPDSRSADWAVARLAAKQPEPFAMFVGFVRPHVPWHVPQKWFDLHPLDRVKLPPHHENEQAGLPATALRFADLPMMPKLDWMKQEQRWEKSVQAYLASTTFADHCVGRVLEALERSAHRDNTVVILFSDHGYHLGEKGLWSKHVLWERATRIPLIVVRPGENKPREIKRPVNHIDLYPTILELAGLPSNKLNEGRSLVPLLDDPAAPGFDASLTTHGRGNHAVRSDRWRYIRYADGTEELYDHDNDPNEWTDLVPTGQHAAVIETLRKFLPAREAEWTPDNATGADYNGFLRSLINGRKSDE
jgi:iduronate 2-sulfatase